MIASLDCFCSECSPLLSKILELLFIPKFLLENMSFNLKATRFANIPFYSKIYELLIVIICLFNLVHLFIPKFPVLVWIFTDFVSDFGEIRRSCNTEIHTLINQNMRIKKFIFE